MILKTYFDTGKEHLIFDALFSTEHQSSLTITEHPVQTGANISDHVYMDPQILTFEIGMSDVMKSSIPGQFSDNASRSVSAYLKLRQLQTQGLPITVVTRLGTYKNMMVENITAPEDNKTTFALRATVTLKEIFVVNVTTVKISERPQKSQETNEGEQKVQKVDESILSKILSF